MKTNKQIRNVCPDFRPLARVLKSRPSRGTSSLCATVGRWARTPTRPPQLLRASLSAP